MDFEDPILPHEVQAEALSKRPPPPDGLPVTLLTSSGEDSGAGVKRHRRSVRSRSDGVPGRRHDAEAKVGKTCSAGRKEESQGGQGPFGELLGKLAEHHEAELEKLRVEILALRMQLHMGAEPRDTPNATPNASESEHAEAQESREKYHGMVPAQGQGGAVHWGVVEQKSIGKESKEAQVADAPNFLLPPRRSCVSSHDDSTLSEPSSAPSARRVSTSSAITSGRRMSTRKSIGSLQPGLSLALQLSSLEAIEILPVWEEKETHRAKVHRRMSTQSTHPLRMSKVRQIDAERRESVVRDQFNMAIAKILGKCIIHPSSMKRICWDMIGFAFLSYDIVMIPFSSAFEPGETTFSLTLNWLTLFFWTLDMLASMMTGFQKGGVTVMVQRQIIARYLSTWFALDAFIVGLDWSMIYAYGGNSTNAGEAIRQGRSLRLLRYVRTVRLIRLFKLKRLFHEIQDHLNTELLSTVFSIFKTVVGLVVANHLIACAWYAMGVSGEENMPSWVRANELEDRTIAYKYTTSLHWSLTQFTPASMEIRPYNEVERIFSVIVLLLALVSFSSFVSTLTASITRLSGMRSNEHRQFWLLRRYLRDLQISRQLSLRVQRYCEYSWDRQHQCVQERDVLLLQHLSEPLREELKAETFAPHLSVHPLIEQLQDCVRRFSSALAALEIAKGDQVFGYGEEAHNMFFVARGELQYSVGADEPESEVTGIGNLPIVAKAEAKKAEAKKADKEKKEKKDNDESDEDSSSSSSDDEDSEKSDVIESVFESDWVSEAVLWTQWDHLGYLEALSDCQLVAIKASVFSEVVSQNAATWTSAQKYGKKFVEELNRVDRSKLTDVLERSLTYIAAKEVGCVGFSPIRSSSAIIRKRERRKGFGVSEYRLRYSTRRCIFRMQFRLQLCVQAAMNRLRRLMRRP